jgi:hypothetical protein
MQFLRLLGGVNVSGDLERFSGDERAGGTPQLGSLRARADVGCARSLSVPSSGLSASERLRGAGWPGRVVLAEQDAPEP